MALCLRVQFFLANPVYKGYCANENIRKLISKPLREYNSLNSFFTSTSGNALSKIDKNSMKNSMKNFIIR